MSSFKSFEICLFSIILSFVTAQALNPIILVPGDGGSQIEAKYNRNENDAIFGCDLKSDWYQIWLNVTELYPFESSCWADNVKLVYNATTHKTQNTKGVETRIPGFGRTESVEYLSQDEDIISEYFVNFVNHFVSIGYERGENIHGAPYDFRKAANELREYFGRIKDLTEMTYYKNGNKPVIFVCHSMGCNNIVYFLNQQTQSWKNKFVRAAITVSGPWAGAVRSMKVYALGDNLGQELMNVDAIRTVQRSSPSLSSLFPNPKFWGKDEVVFILNDKNVTVHDMELFFDLMGVPTGLQMYNDVKNLVVDLKPPNVELHCIYSYGYETVEAVMIYDDEGISTDLYGDGDASVNLRSLEASKTWIGKQKQKIFHKRFYKEGHLNIVRSQKVAKFVLHTVKKLQTSSPEI